MRHKALIAAAGLVFACASQNLVAQTQPAQPQDPTQQSPATRAPSPSRRAGQRAAEMRSEAAGESSSPTQVKARPFMGTVVRRQNNYFLRAGDLEYKLDDSSAAHKYEGHSVKVLGNLEKQSNTIHVETIEPSPGP
jgi:hypothetical protein